MSFVFRYYTILVLCIREILFITRFIVDVAICASRLRWDLHVGGLDGSVQGVQKGLSDRTLPRVNTATQPCLHFRKMQIITYFSLMPNPKISSKHQQDGLDKTDIWNWK
jgi:hypothetical protein